MVALPNVTDLTSNSLTESQLRASLTNLHDYIAQHLNTLGTKADARLGLDMPFNDTLTVTGNITLDTSAAGAVVNVTSATPCTVMLPSAADAGRHFVLVFRNGPATTTLQSVVGTDLVDGSVSFAIPARAIVIIHAATSSAFTVTRMLGKDGGGLLFGGTNANGRYLRDLGGIQWCWRSTSVPNVTTVSGSGFRSADSNWTFPAAFSGGAVCTGRAANGCWPAFWQPVNASVNWRVQSWASQASTIAVHQLAFGWW